MDINNLRNNINEIDGEILSLFIKRMDTVSKIGEYKKENSLPVVDSKREREHLYSLIKNAGEYSGYVKTLFNTVFEASRSMQFSVINNSKETAKKIKEAVLNTPKLFPQSGTIACQGDEGAYSVLACEKLFSPPNIMFMSTFEKVFEAVNSGLCEYGILPLENSAAGSVNSVYELMHKYNFYIAKSVRLCISHSLLANHGADINSIKEVFSHEQALMQCSEFLKSMPDIKITQSENTATSAKLLADTNRTDAAVISSQNCTQLYSLKSLKNGIQNTDNNYTRFICISKKLQIYPGAGRTSIMLSLPHKPGSLYSVMSKFNALSINLNKLESRPVEGSDFLFRFYFDIDADVNSPEFIQIINELENEYEEFNYLGSYYEI